MLRLYDLLDDTDSKIYVALNLKKNLYQRIPVVINRKHNALPPAW
jgi:hypothetical protein